MGQPGGDRYSAIGIGEYLAWIRRAVAEPV